ncbi:hypothetical protein Q7C36_000780 [Tachysurus vachellii]|uniref:Uncharacterized protein n=1 Tax=Tachysurus vachellii TaxID=175792 RepID=A0AA88TAT2_TACVA|nr:hypothetical protein Q7C36_000780 [Tachysurus vachellii]
MTFQSSTLQRGDFAPENSKQEYLIECRSIGGKRPTNGWTVETAHILQLAEKESTLMTAEHKLLQEDLLKSKKRKRVPNKLYLDTQEVEKVAKKKNYRLIAARAVVPKKNLTTAQWGLL